MDYYKILGLNKSATKSEIKNAFRKLAIKFHPDKHSASSKPIKDSATLKFKQVSEAYDVLSNDSKRADYNLRHSGSSSSNYYNNNNNNNNNNVYGNAYSSRTNTHSGSGKGPSGYGYSPSSSTSNNNGFAFKFERFARYLSTRDFLLHATFLGIILGGSLIIHEGRELLWDLQNSGKSFEAAMDNIQKAKADKDKE